MLRIIIKSLLVFTILISAGDGLSAQYVETIRAIRPGQATGTYTIGKNVFQTQSGFTTRSFELNDLKRNTSVGKTVLRWGILERFEFNSVIQWSNVKTTRMGSSTSVSGISSTQLGARLNILDAKKDPIALAVQGRMLLTLQDEAFQRDKIGSKWVVSAAGKIAPKLALLTNYAITWSGNGGDPSSNYTLRLASSFAPKFQGVLEMYGSLDNFNTSFDVGIGYFINNDLKLDLSSGFLAGEDQTDRFFDLGFSWRTNWRGEDN